MLTSFCPTINKLIENEYPTLIDHLLPYDYPVEIAAKRLKKNIMIVISGSFHFVNVYQS
ncbi:[Fe-Fe] hydrogenase large subunit C-terminal domain-containing protein [Coprobacillaceae bacterium CR2/5/TPMF4]|nr:[Fe-Fe] hydrogenase large subunit C-terminal domain-containing protein [Coprobacillaceae bacterium CR2/5/TPMF4]